MDEEIERLVVQVRADTRGFAVDVGAMRGTLEAGLGQGAERAGRALEAGLVRAVRTGTVGLDDLKRVALSAMADIARASVSTGVAAAGGGGLAGLAGRLLGAALGLPGRATGGPVSPGAAYLVGERGPEMFVPTAAGRVVAAGGGGGAREVRVAITVNAAAGAAPGALERSGRQVARAVRAALVAAER